MPNQYTVLGINFNACGGEALSLQDAVPYVAGMTKGNNESVADSIQIQNAAGGWDTYYLSNGRNAKNTATIAGLDSKWAKLGQYTPTTATVEPGQAFWYIRQSTESPLSLTVAGELGVSTNKLVDLTYKFISNLYPVEQEKEYAPKITSALQQAGFGEKLAKLKDGLFTQVTTEFDKEGVDFSGGESQKVAISRAFYKSADILIMDEPSSALDPIAEYELNKAMQTAAKGKTVFYISHRLSTTRDADRIIMLERGKIIEEGTHAQLLRRKGKYAEMWNAQAGKYN